MRVAAVSSFLSIVLSAACFGASIDMLRSQFPQVQSYYDDLNFIQKNSTQAERGLILLALSRSEQPTIKPFQWRLSRVADAIARTRGVHQGLDAKMVRGDMGSWDYSDPIEVKGVQITDKEHIAVSVARLLGAGARNTSSGHLGGRNGWITTEVDYWQLVDGRWVLCAMHAFLL